MILVVGWKNDADNYKRPFVNDIVIEWLSLFRALFIVAMTTLCTVYFQIQVSVILNSLQEKNISSILWPIVNAKFSLTIFVFLYIECKKHIYMRVCVCVCVRMLVS